MADIKVDERLDELDGLMSKLGFRRALDRSKSSNELKQIHGIRYADPDGNVIDLNFSLRVSREGSGLMIDTLFNSGAPQSWTSMDAVLRGLAATVEEWVRSEQDRRKAAEAGPSQPPPLTPQRSSEMRAAILAAAKGRIPAKQILDDVKAGMTDSELMGKYRLSHRRLLSVISKFVWDGLLTQQELSDRKGLAKTVFMPVFQCRLCKTILLDKGDECPNCGGPMKIVNRKD